MMHLSRSLCDTKPTNRGMHTVKCRPKFTRRNSNNSTQDGAPCPTHLLLSPGRRP
jgi:hypothetical protein